MWSVSTALADKGTPPPPSYRSSLHWSLGAVNSQSALYVSRWWKSHCVLQGLQTCFLSALTSPPAAFPSASSKWNTIAFGVNSATQLWVPTPIDYNRLLWNLWARNWTPQLCLTVCILTYCHSGLVEFPGNHLRSECWHPCNFQHLSNIFFLSMRINLCPLFRHQYIYIFFLWCTTALH